MANGISPEKATLLSGKFVLWWKLNVRIQINSLSERSYSLILMSNSNKIEKYKVILLQLTQRQIYNKKEHIFLRVPTYLSFMNQVKYLKNVLFTFLVNL